MGAGPFETSEKLLTRRGVLWLGQTCNLRCHFCYFLDRIEDVHHVEHRFMELEKAEEICRALRERYGNTAVDIQGGEPTIWRHIDALVAFCAGIGLAPTLITNGVSLADRDKCASLKAAGVRDLLISVQGLGDTYDEIVGRRGSWIKQLQALRNCVELEIPFRFNCVLSAKALPQLVEIARLAVDAGARGVNFLAFNPFEDQGAGRRSTDNVPRYSEVAEALAPALDLLGAAGVEANVRYLPFCMVPERHRSSVYNFQQLSYDAHEWDFDSWTWTNLQPQRMNGSPTSEHHASLASVTYGRPPSATTRGHVAKAVLRRVLDRWPAGLDRARRLYWRAQVRTQARRAAAGPSGARPPFLVTDELGRNPQVYRDEGARRAGEACGYQAVPACSACSLQRICDGFHADYTSMFGGDEARPVQLDALVDDPLHYAVAQVKVYEAEERARPFARVWPPAARPLASPEALDAFARAYAPASAHPVVIRPPVVESAPG